MKTLCEICHKEKATGTKWLEPEQSPIGVGGVYRVCEVHGGPSRKHKIYET